MVEARVPLTPERRRELTRMALIDAAAVAFARRGIAGASLDEIAAAAGYTKGAVYSNFDGKADLLLAVVEQLGERLISAMRDVHLSAEAVLTPAGGQASEAADAWRRIVASDEDTQLLRLELRLYALRNADFRPRLAALQRRQLDQVVVLLTDAAPMADGQRFGLPPRALAGILIPLTEGLLLQAAVDPDHRREHEELFGLLLARLAENEGRRAKTKP